jgi:hypothetical protein
VDARTLRCMVCVPSELSVDARRRWLSTLRRDAVGAQDSGDSALIVACRRGALDIARLLVSEAGCDPTTERNNVCCATVCI